MFSLTSSIRNTSSRRSKVRPLAGALGFQALLLALTVIVVVVVPSEDRDPEFTASKTIYLPQRELEHQAAVSEFQQAASAPTLSERLTTESLLADALPEIQALPSEQFAPFEVHNPMANASDLLGASGLMGALQGLDAGSSQFSFLGVQDNATRIVIAFDVSRSVINNMNKSGMNLGRIREETTELINNLNANTLFSIVQFVRAYDLFENYLVPATVTNRERATGWLQKYFHTGGSSGRGWIRRHPDGIQTVMEAIFRLEPDVIILISDASFHRTPGGPGTNEKVPSSELERDIQRYQKQLPREARIHFVGFGVKPEEKRDIQRLVRRNGGHYREY